MNVILPVSTIDMDLMKLLGARLVKLGGLEGERVIVAASQRAAWDIGLLMIILRPLNAELFVLPTEDEIGWPESAGHAFFEVFQWLAENDNKDATMYLEADCVAMIPTWFSRIKEEYEREGKPFWGKVEPSRWVNLLTGECSERGTHLVGGAGSIYPANIFELAPTLNYLTRIPYDVELGDEIAPQTFATKLVAHRFRTCNYRREKGILTCDNFKPKPYQHLYAAPIPIGTCLIHGAKDDSLYRLLDLEERAV